MLTNKTVATLMSLDKLWSHFDQLILCLFKLVFSSCHCLINHLLDCWCVVGVKDITYPLLI